MQGGSRTDRVFCCDGNHLSLDQNSPNLSGFSVNFSNCRTSQQHRVKPDVWGTSVLSRRIKEAEMGTATAYVPRELLGINEKIAEGHGYRRVTVRDLLGMFNAERRGQRIIHEIRRALNSLNLVTVPDFESAWIDSDLKFRMRSTEKTDAATETGTETTGELDACNADDEPDSHIVPVIDVPEAETITKPTASPNPMFRIGSLPAANKSLVTLCQDDSVTTALACMLINDYSQVPIMQGEREVKGMVT
jgi:CBS domain-containing protein